MSNQQPWAFLDAHRGLDFQGTWPTLPQMLSITAKRYPANLFLRLPGHRELDFTYNQAVTKVKQIAGWLRDQGFAKGSKAVVTGVNSPQWVLAYLAVLWAGGTVVPIDHQLGTAEIETLLRVSGSEFLFCDQATWDHWTHSSLKLKNKVSLTPGLSPYILDLEAQPLESPALLNDTDSAALLFTSGTTGTPKGVVLSHGNLISDCFLAQGNLTIYSRDIFYALLPLHHSYTMLAVFIEGLSVGACLVFGQKMAVTQILQDLKNEKITMFLGVPMIFNKLLAGIEAGLAKQKKFVQNILSFLFNLTGVFKAITGLNLGKFFFKGILKKASLSTLRICISGGGPLAPQVFKKLNQLGLDFVQGYGLTEASPILALNPVSHFKVESVGKLLPMVEAKIIEPDSQGNGVIAVRGPMVMQGYYQDIEATAQVLSPEGWLNTGDVGRLDEENYLYLTGRAKSLIVTEGGKNVYPEEIENAFQLYPLVEQILVRGFLADPLTRAEGIEALIYPLETEYQSKGEAWVKKEIQYLVDQVNQGLLPYQRISRWTLLDKPLAMTTTKKIKR